MMDNQWKKIAMNLGLETHEGYKKLFLNSKHYWNDNVKRGEFHDGDTYVSMEKAIEALKLTEKAMMKKYEKSKTICTPTPVRFPNDSTYTSVYGFSIHDCSSIRAYSDEVFLCWRGITCAIPISVYEEKTKKTNGL